MLWYTLKEENNAEETFAIDPTHSQKSYNKRDTDTIPNDNDTIPYLFVDYRLK